MNILRNITILYCIKACKWFMLYMPVILLFYRENNFQNTELIGLHAIYSIVIAIMEIPSGYMADSFGRKHSLMLGTFMGFLGFFIYSLSYGLLGFITAEIFLGIGQSFISGSDSALMYDTLLEKKKTSSYVLYEGRITAIGNFSESIAGLLVSLLAFTVMRHYFYIQTAFALMAFLFSFFLIEPKAHKPRSKKNISDMLSILHSSLKTNITLRYYLIFSSIIGFASLTMAWFAQIIFFDVNLPKHFYGYAWTLLNITVGLGSMSAPIIAKKYREKIIIPYLFLTISIGFVLIGLNLTYWALGILICLFFIRGTAHPILKKYINEHTDSSKRATVLSIRSLMIRIGFSTLGPLIALISDKISVSIALILCAVPIFILGGIVGLLIIQNNSHPIEN